MPLMLLFVIVVTLYSPSFLGQARAKGPFGLRVYHTRWRLHAVPLIHEGQAGKLRIPIFRVFSLTRPEILLWFANLGLFFQSLT